MKKTQAAALVRVAETLCRTAPVAPVLVDKGNGTKWPRWAERGGPMIRLQKVLEYTGQSKSGLYRRLAQQAFPEPVRLGPKSVFFYLREVEAWTARVGKEAA